MIVAAIAVVVAGLAVAVAVSLSGKKEGATGTAPTAANTTDPPRPAGGKPKADDPSDDEADDPKAKDALAPKLAPDEVFARLARATVFVGTPRADKKVPELVNVGWVVHTQQSVVVVTCAEAVVVGRPTRVIFPAFNDKDELIRDFDYYRTKIFSDRYDDLVYDAELIHTDKRDEIGLAALRVVPRDKQKPPRVTPLRLAAASSPVGEPLCCPDVTGWGNGVVLTPLYPKSQGAIRQDNALGIDRVIPVQNRGGPVVNERCEVVATVYGPNAAEKGQNSPITTSRGVDVGRVRGFLKDSLQKVGQTWSESQGAPAAHKDRLPAYLAALTKATRPDHLLDRRVEPLPVIPAEAKARQLQNLRRIGELGEEARGAVPQLVPYLRSADPEVRRTAYQVILGIRSVNELDRSLFAAALRSWSLESRMYAAWVYGRVAAPADTVEELGELLREPDPANEKAELRVLVLRAIAHNKVNTGRQLTLAVIHRLDDPVGEVRNAAVEALEELRAGGSLESWFVEGLAGMIKSGAGPQPGAGAAANPQGVTLGFGRQLAAMLMAKYLDIKQVQYAWYREVFYPLLSVRPEKAENLVAEKTAQELRITAAKALARWGRAAEDCLRPHLPKSRGDWQDGHFKGLTDLTADPIHNVRLEAIKAIREIGSRAGERLVFDSGRIDRLEKVDLVEVLDQLAESDPDDGVRDAAREASLALAERAPAERDVPLLRKLLKVTDDRARREATRPLRLRAARLLGLIVAKAKDPAAAQTAVAAAVPELVAAVRQPDAPDGPDEDLQTTALLSLVRIGDHLAGQAGPEVALVAKVAGEILTPVGKGVGGGPAVAAPAGGDMATRLLRCTVWVHTNSGDGSGVVVSGGGSPLVLTNHHVVAGDHQITVFFPDYTPDRREIGDASHYLSRLPALRTARRAQAAMLVGTAPDRDLTLLRLEAPLPEGAAPVRIARESARAGQNLHLRGMSGVNDGSLWRYSPGQVRQLVQDKSFVYRNGQAVRCTVLEHTLPTNPGDSGAAVVNDRGELVGLNCARDPKSQSVALAIDRDEIDKFLRARRPTAPTGAGGPRAEPDVTTPAELIGLSGAALSVQQAAVQLLRSLGPASITQLAESLPKAGSPAQAMAISNALREFAEQYGPKDHPVLVSAGVALLVPTGSRSADPDIREETSRLVATIGGVTVISAVRDLLPWGGISLSQLPIESVRWATRTLGRLDPQSRWLQPVELRKEILGSNSLRKEYAKYIRNNTINDADLMEIRERLFDEVAKRLTWLRDKQDPKKKDRELAEEAGKGIEQLKRPGVK